MLKSAISDPWTKLKKVLSNGSRKKIKKIFKSQKIKQTVLKEAKIHSYGKKFISNQNLIIQIDLITDNLKIRVLLLIITIY